MFPGDIYESDSQNSNDSNVSSSSRLSLINPWLAGAVYHTMRLTLMAVAGYSYYREHHHRGLAVGKKIESPMSSSGGRDRDVIVYCDFPLPDENNSELTSTPQKIEYVVSSSHINSISNTGLSTSTSASIIRVVCVEFHYVDDVENLWLETVKLFSDLASSRPIEISKNATYCMKVNYP